MVKINISFKSWRTWFELSTIILAVAIFIAINVRTPEVTTGVALLAINWIVSVAIGLRKY